MTRKKAPAAWPETKEQFFGHWSDGTSAGEKLLVPPNSTIMKGRARPTLSLSKALTIRPGPSANDRAMKAMTLGLTHSLSRRGMSRASEAPTTKMATA